MTRTARARARVEWALDHLGVDRAQVLAVLALADATTLGGPAAAELAIRAWCARQVADDAALLAEARRTIGALSARVDLLAAELLRVHAAEERAGVAPLHPRAAVRAPGRASGAP